MAGLLIWVPVSQIETRGEVLLERAGLGGLIRAGDALPVATQQPVGRPAPRGDDEAVETGQLVFWDETTDPERTPSPASVNLERQTWRALSPRDGLAAGRGMIGWWNERPPRPSDLERKRQYAGEEVTLADGRSWLVPVMRMLPTVMEFDAAGELKQSYVSDAYRAMADRTWELFERFRASQKPVEGSEEQSQAALDLKTYTYFFADVLQMNYRVNVDVVTALRLVANDSADLLLAAAGAAALQKKT